MTPEELQRELERKVAEIFHSELCGGCSSEGDNQNNCCEKCSCLPHGKKNPLKDHPNDLNTLTDDQIYALLAWEFWKDGMDWEQGISDIATGQYLPFNTREATIDQLRKVFGY